MNSLIQPLAANVPGIQRVNILVGGKMRETLAGSEDVTELVRFIESAARGLTK